MNRRVKLAALLVAFVLVIGATTGIIIAANDSAPSTVEITRKNIAFGEGINLAFVIEVTGGKSGNVGLAVWDVNEEGDYSIKNVKHLTYTEDYKTTGDLVEKVAFSHGIAPKDVKTDYVFAAVYCDELTGKITFGEKLVYSVEDYINEMLAGETTEAQRNMYEKLLSYSDIASDVLGAE